MGFRRILEKLENNIFSFDKGPKIIDILIKSSINSNSSNNKSFCTSAIAQDLFSNPVLIEVQAECREKIS